ncbi:MAG: hypothetical protein SW833_26900 [Cyanobacteriota bacterium]|nr:hypothetical protein [Cyanobacteriota bacterium]
MPSGVCWVTVKVSSPEAMKLPQLKQQVYDCWESLSTFNGAIVQPDNFKAEVRKFGDLRYKRTWENAYCSFWAQNIRDACLDSYELITIYFNYKPDLWDYYLRHQVFEEFLSLPDSVQMLKTGLEQLFLSDFTPQEREEAHEFFILAEEQSRRRGINGDATRFIRQLAEFT